jgi:hypothetical protein
MHAVSWKSTASSDHAPCKRRAQAPRNCSLNKFFTMFRIRIPDGLTFASVSITFVIVVGPRIGCGAGVGPEPIVAVDGGHRVFDRTTGK